VIVVSAPALAISGLSEYCLLISLYKQKEVKKMLQAIRLEEPLKESSDRQTEPRPDPFLVSLIETIVETVEAIKKTEEEDQPNLRGNGITAMEEIRKTPVTRPSRVRFNLD
jgi:hypothetical protein